MQLLRHPWSGEARVERQARDRHRKTSKKSGVFRREFLPARPDYLADLTGLTNGGTVRGNLRLTQGGGGPQINGRRYQPGDIEERFSMGDVVQRSVTVRKQTNGLFSDKPLCCSNPD